MNWLLLLVILIIAWNVVRGYTRGFIRIVYSLVAWLLVGMLALAVTPYVADYIKENTSIQKDIKDNAYNKIKEGIAEENNSLEEKEENGVQKENEESEDRYSEYYKEIEKLGMPIPDSILKEVFGKDNLADGIMEETGLYDLLSEKISEVAVDGIAFGLSAIALGLIFLILYQVLAIVEKLPVINGINKSVGIIFGLIQGMFIVWIIFAIVAMSCTSKYGIIMISYIYENPLLQTIYENNLVLTLIMAIL